MSQTFAISPSCSLLDENLESSAQKESCKVLLVCDTTALAIVLSAIFVLHGEKIKFGYFMGQLTFQTVCWLLVGIGHFLYRQWAKFDLSEKNQRIERARNPEERRRLDKCLDPMSVLFRIAPAGEGGIRYSLFALFVFAVWVICEAANLTA
jgi:hypothetical protein